MTVKKSCCSLLKPIPDIKTFLKSLSPTTKGLYPITLLKKPDALSIGIKVLEKNTKMLLTITPIKTLLCSFLEIKPIISPNKTNIPAIKNKKKDIN